MNMQLLPCYQRKNKQFNFRLTKDELRIINNLCKENKISNSELVRRSLNDYAAKQYKEYCNQVVTS